MSSPAGVRGLLHGAIGERAIDLVEPFNLQLAPRNGYHFGSDFISRFEDGGFTSDAAGGGGVTNSFNPTADTEQGIAYVYAGNTGTGRSAIRSWSLDHIYHSTNWRHRMSAKWRQYNTATAGEDYTTYVGLLDSVTATPADGCYFYHARGGNILAVIRNGSSTISSVDTGIADSTTYRHFEIDLDGTTSARFKIDGVTVSNYTGGSVPTGSSKLMGWSAGCIGVAGTAFTRAILMDWFFANGRTRANRAT